MMRLTVFGSRVKPNRLYQIIKVINGGDDSRKEEIISDVMKGQDLFRVYGSETNQKRYEVQRRKRP